jgi:hypothetical protein
MSKCLDPVRLPDSRPRMPIRMRLNMPMLHDPESDPRQLFQLYVDPELVDPDKDPASRVRIRIYKHLDSDIRVFQRKAPPKSA